MGKSTPWLDNDSAEVLALIARKFRTAKGNIGKITLGTIDQEILKDWLLRVCVSRQLLETHIAYLEQELGRQLPKNKLLSDENLRDVLNDRRVYEMTADILPIYITIALNPLALNQILDEVYHGKPLAWLDIVVKEPSLSRAFREDFLHASPHCKEWLREKKRAQACGKIFQKKSPRSRK